MPRSAAQCSISGSERDWPGPQSRDDDEDSSPLIQDLDLADHVPCSTRDMTTSGHEYPTLTHPLGASALGSGIHGSENAKLTDSDRRVTPECPVKYAKLTVCTKKTKTKKFFYGYFFGRLSSSMYSKL